jgi:hypothetical protein
MAIPSEKEMEEAGALALEMTKALIIKEGAAAAQSDDDEYDSEVEDVHDVRALRRRRGENDDEEDSTAGDFADADSHLQVSGFARKDHTHHQHHRVVKY